MNDELRDVFSKVFMWLFVGLLITFGMGYGIQESTLMDTLFSGGLYLFVWLAEIVIAIVLAVRIRKIKPLTATILYLFYTALTGITFATIFAYFELGSIMIIFGVTALIMLLFGLVGYFTKIDLTKISTFLFMGILAIIIMSVVNLFIGSESLDLGLCIVGIIIFMAYIAFDIQAIKRKLYGIENQDSLAIYGAFQLYLDFVNIFLDLLRLFGNSRD